MVLSPRRAARPRHPRGCPGRAGGRTRAKSSYRVRRCPRSQGADPSLPPHRSSPEYMTMRTFPTGDLASTLHEEIYALAVKITRRSCNMGAEMVKGGLKVSAGGQGR